MAKKKANSRRSDAERMASQHRQANISEYFDRNIAQLGFNSKQKALVTAVKRALTMPSMPVRSLASFPACWSKPFPWLIKTSSSSSFGQWSWIPRKSIDRVLPNFSMAPNFTGFSRPAASKGWHLSGRNVRTQDHGSTRWVVSKPQPKKPRSVILKIDVERNCAEILEERVLRHKDWFPDGTGVHIEIP